MGHHTTDDLVQKGEIELDISLVKKTLRKSIFDLAALAMASWRRPSVDTGGTKTFSETISE